MYTRPSSYSHDSQLASQEWFDPARRVAAHVGVDHGAVAGLEEERVMGIVRIARRALERHVPVVRSPRYSMMRVPLRIVRVANTPRPWIFELRTT